MARKNTSTDPVNQQAMLKSLDRALHAGEPVLAAGVAYEHTGKGRGGAYGTVVVTPARILVGDWDTGHRQSHQWHEIRSMQVVRPNPLLRPSVLISLNSDVVGEVREFATDKAVTDVLSNMQLGLIKSSGLVPEVTEGQLVTYPSFPFNRVECLKCGGDAGWVTPAGDAEKIKPRERCLLCLRSVTGVEGYA